MSRKIALVIGWGGVKCAAALGLVRVLRQAGIEIGMVVAGGGGSIFGSLIALGYDVEKIVELSQQLWTPEVTAQPNHGATLQILLPRIFGAGKYFSLRDDALMNERLRALFGDHTFAEVQIPLFIAATDYQTGNQVVISRGSLFQAVRASVALPMIFPPSATSGQLLMDGYLSDPLPVGIAIQEGATLILALGVQTVSTTARKSFFDYVMHLSGVISDNLFQASYAFYNLAHHDEVLLIMPQFAPDIQMFDAHKLPEIIRAGEVEAEKILPRLKQMLELAQ